MIKKFTTLPSPKRVHKDKDKYYTVNAYITSSLQTQNHFSSLHRMMEMVIYKFNTKLNSLQKWEGVKDIY